MNQETKEFKDEVIDHIDKAFIKKREEIPISWSPVMKQVLDRLIEMDEKINALDKKIDTRTQWIQDTFAGGKILSKVSTAIVKFLITVTALSGAWIWFKNTLKP